MFHKMEHIIYITIAAVIAGAQSWNEIAEIGKSKLDFFKKRLQGLETIPSHIIRMLLDSHNLNAVVTILDDTWQHILLKFCISANLLSILCHVDDAVESFSFLLSQNLVAGIVFSFCYEHLVTECLLVAIVGICSGFLWVLNFHSPSKQSIFFIKSPFIFHFHSLVFSCQAVR